MEENKKTEQIAPPVITCQEDRFHYRIAESCVRCGACAAACPAHAIRREAQQYQIDPALCIDCGTCSAVCPKGAARPAPLVRESIDLSEIEESPFSGTASVCCGDNFYGNMAQNESRKSKPCCAVGGYHV